MLLAHKIEIKPTVTQAMYLRRAVGVARFTYNWALQEWKSQYSTGGKPKGTELKRLFNSLREEQFPWTYEVHRDCTSQPFANLQTAFSRFFKKKAKYPKLHKKGKKDSFYLSNDKFEVLGEKIRIPKLGWVKLTEALRFQGKLMAAVVSRKANRWFVSISVDTVVLPLPKRTECVGVDLGIKQAVSLSTGKQIAAPKPLKHGLKRLKRLHSQVSRKVKGSQNRRKAAVRLAKQYWHIANIRKDFWHQITTNLIRQNQTIVIEDLNVKGMVKNRKLSCALSDIGFGEFRRQLTYKSKLYGRDLVVVSRWFPSSKTCSSCGHVKVELSLSERMYKCNECGFELDRDLNAALNLNKLGRVTTEVTPVDRLPILDSPAIQQATWMKQESQGEHLCSPRK